MKHINFYWKRPYARLHEMGYAAEAFVVFGKYGYEQQVYTNKENMRRTYYNKYSYILGVDLCIVRLKFSWIGRERKAPND